MQHLGPFLMGVGAKRHLTHTGQLVSIAVRQCRRERMPVVGWHSWAASSQVIAQPLQIESGAGYCVTAYNPVHISGQFSSGSSLEFCSFLLGTDTNSGCMSAELYDILGLKPTRVACSSGHGSSLD